MAPKPVVILAKEKDYFDVRGAEEAFGRLRRLYKLLGAEENVKLHVGPTGHGYSIENREAMYQWFNTVTGVSDVKTEPKLVIEKEEDLYAAPKGQVSELNSRTVFSFTAATARQLEDARRVKPGALAKRVRDALDLPTSDSAPDYRILRPVTGRKYPKPFATAYALETEKPAVAVVYRLDDQQHLSRPPKNTGGATVYVSHHSADAELRDEPLLTELVKAEPKTVFYACDVRGVGESRPDTCGGTNQFLTAYGSDYFYAAHGVMLDRPYVGQKTFDVLRVLEWLKTVGHKEVHLVAKGWGAIPATFAALLSGLVTRVTLKNALASYSDVARAEQYVWPLSCFVPGVLRSFDLPDCYAALAAKQLRLIDPWGADGKPK